MMPFPFAALLVGTSAAATSPVALTCVVSEGTVLVTVSATDGIAQGVRFELTVTGGRGNRIVQRGAAALAQRGTMLARARIADDGSWSAMVRDLDADVPIASCRAGPAPRAG